MTCTFVGLAYQAKDIVFRFIIEYSSLRDFGPLGNRPIFIWGFLFLFLFWAHNSRPNWQIVGEDPKSGPIEDSRQEFHLHFSGPRAPEGARPGSHHPRGSYLRIFERSYFGFCWNLRLSYRAIISWRILVSSRGFFEDYILAWWNTWVSIILLLPSYTFLSVNDKATVWHNPCSLPTVFGGHHISLNNPPREGEGD